MIDITLKKEDVIRINKLLQELSPREQGKAIHKGLVKGSSVVLKNLSTNISGRILKKRTGELSRSMGFRVEKDNRGIFGSEIGSGASLKTKRKVYANILEEGGTVRPVRAKKLAIPIGNALTPAGVARFTPTELREGLAGYSGSFIRKSKSGNLILFGTVKSVTKIKVIPLFVLKDKVRIPAKQYMGVTAEETGDVAVDKICEAIDEVRNQ